MEESILKLPHTYIDTVYLFTNITTIFRRLKILLTFKKINYINQLDDWNCPDFILFALHSYCIMISL